MDQRILQELVLNESILSVIANYFHAQPYLREISDLAITYPDHDMPSTREVRDPHDYKLNFGWHYDTVNMVQFAMLLNDVSEKDTHMLAAIGEHRRHRHSLGVDDYYYSDEYMNANHKVFHLAGPRGTIHLFDSNAQHRLWISKNTLRINIKVCFTPGNDILAPEKNQLDTSEIDLSRLSTLQRTAIKHFLKKSNTVEQK